jgi:hypothetical protein
LATREREVVKRRSRGRLRRCCSEAVVGRRDKERIGRKGQKASENRELVRRYEE